MATVALDSNVFIAALSAGEPHSVVAQQLVRDIAQGVHSAVASSIAFGEVLGVSDAAQELDLAAFFSSMVNLVTVPADDAICLRAAELRRRHGSKLKLPDALHLATALGMKVDVFITNDITLAKVASSVMATKSLSEYP